MRRNTPGEINFGSAGNGSTPHMSGELLKTMADINIVHVPYRGTGPAMNDLIGGHIQMFFDLLPASLQQITSGKVRPLANAGAARPAVLANLPTVAEQGLPGFDANSWEGLVAPAATPAPVQAKLIAEVKKVLAAPDVIARVEALGSEPGTAFGKDFGAFMQAEIAKWAAVIKKSGARRSESFLGGANGSGLWPAR
jgi:tripartite-type tricarboxylate transporter receptor subunit TctC